MSPRVLLRNRLDPDIPQQVHLGVGQWRSTGYASPPSIGTGGGGTDPISALRLPHGGTFVDYCGVVGGIPTYTTQSGSTISPYTGGPATIVNAFNGAASDTYVQLGAGTFNISNIMDLNASRVELRGTVDSNGVPTTIINFTGGGDRLIHLRATGWDLTNSGQFTSRDITSPAAGSLRGVTQVTLASAPTNLQVNQLMWVSSTQTFIGSTPSSDFLGNEHSQIVRVSQISGNDVSFNPAINADYLSGTVTCYWRTVGAHVRLSGLRNIKITGAIGHHFGTSGSDECWLYNVHSAGTPANANHIHPYGDYRLEINHCDISDIAGDSNSAYCIQPHQSSQFLIVNNYFHDIPNVMPMMGLSGSAFAYNYCNDFPYTDPAWLSQGVFFHGAHSAYNLFEGNWSPCHHLDAFGNTGSRNNIWLRNRSRGWDATPSPTGKTDNTKCFAIADVNVNVSIVGNVLGENNYHTAYENTSNEFDNASIYYRQTSVTGLQRVGNYNYVNDAVPAAEALGGSETIVSSYLYSAKPSWFGASQPWPPIDPTNPTQSNNFENIPAGYRSSHSGVDP